MIGVPKGSGNWFEQQWGWISNLGKANPWTMAFAAATLIIILGFKRFAPKIPGALIAVILLIAVSAATDAASHGVARSARCRAVSRPSACRREDVLRRDPGDPDRARASS